MEKAVTVKNCNGVKLKLSPGPNGEFTMITLRNAPGTAIICLNANLQENMDRIVEDDLHGFTFVVDKEG